MFSELSILNRFKFTPMEWNLVKILSIIFWLLLTIPILLKYHNQPQPEGICNYINCAFFSSSSFTYFTFGFLLIVSLLYLLERFMLLSIFLIAVLSVIIFSLEISNAGHSSRTEIVSMLFIIQFIAYLRYSLGGNKFKEETTAYNVAMMYSIQIIAAAYIISGISKLGESGIGWVTEAQNISVRILRSYSSRAVDLDDSNLEQRGRNLAAFVLQHQTLIKIGFAGALFAEICAFIAMFGKRHAHYYLIVILLLQGGIFLTFGGVIIPFIVLNVIYFFPFSLWRKLSSNENVEGNDLSDSKQGIFSKILTSVFNFKIAILYIIFTFIVPEVHPISRFAMFSSSSNEADYYYFTDENNNPLSGLKNFSIRTNEIKNLVYAQAEKSGLNTSENEQLQVAAQQVLKNILFRQSSSSDRKYFKELKLVRHDIHLTNGRIKEQDVVLSSVSAE